MRIFPEADVIWWNAKSYYIRCPFCESVHRHSINWKAKRVRMSHCEKMDSYLCCFPMNDQGEVAYEIDKKRGRYNNICVSHNSDIENNDDDVVDHLATQFAQRVTLTAQREEMYAHIYEDSKEMVTIDVGHGIEPFEQKRILTPISDCVNGNTAAVQRYLETSNEAQLFIKGRESDGKTTLISAAAESSSEMLSLLIEHGAEVNAVDNHGRSALMEAALFGRVQNIEVLLQHSADKDIRDDENRRAVDFARDQYKNRCERYKRAGGDVMSSFTRPLGYVEDTFQRDRDRREIVRLLSGENRKSNIVFGSPPTLSPSRSHYFMPSPMGNSLVFSGPIEEYPITTRWKTVARLERGGKFPSVGAMSGWSHDALNSLRVDGRQWTKDVLYIAEVVGHILLRDSRDQGKDGQYHACHAEKQLIAYFIERHVFLPRDSAPDLEQEKRIKRAKDDLQELLSKTEIGRKVTSLRKKKKDLEDKLFDGDEKLVGKDDEITALQSELKSIKFTLNQLIANPEARRLLRLESRLDILNRELNRHADLVEMTKAPPPASLTEAVIMISSPPCEDCVAFKDTVNKFFKLSIQLYAAL